ICVVLRMADSFPLLRSQAWMVVPYRCVSAALSSVVYAACLSGNTHLARNRRLFARYDVDPMRSIYWSKSSQNCRLESFEEDALFDAEVHFLTNDSLFFFGSELV